MSLVHPGRAGKNQDVGRRSDGRVASEAKRKLASCRKAKTRCSVLFCSVINLARENLASNIKVAGVSPTVGIRKLKMHKSASLAERCSFVHL